jgi:hypothetical protein
MSEESMDTLQPTDGKRLVALSAAAAIAFAALLAPSASAADKVPAPKLPPAKESWLLSESPSFTVVGNVSAKKVTEIAETLEYFRATLLRLKPSASSVSPVPTLFVAFANDRSFDPYKNSPDSRDVQWVGTSQASQFGNFFAVNAYPAQGNGMAIVFGSYAGYFLRSNYPTTPLWLLEGLSELYGTFRIEGGVADIGRPSAENLGVLRHAPLMSLREVLATTAASPAYAPENRSIFSAHSWVLAHYLLYGAADGQQRTADFLRRLEAGEPESTAFPAAFGVEIDKFEGRVRQYAASTGFDFQRLAVGELPPAAVSVPRALSRPEMLTLLAGLPASMRHLDFAQQHLDAAIAAEPGNGDAWALAGWIAETRQDAAGAAVAYRRALGSSVKRAASWVYIGRWQLSGAEAGGASAEREAAAAAARQSAESALAVAPEFGEAAALKGRAALVQKEYPAAIAALAEAQLRLPERSDIVFNRVVAHLGAGQLIQARALTEGRLRRLAQPAMVEQARQMVAQREAAKLIEDALAKANQAASSGDLDGAIAAFTEAEAKVTTPEGKEYLRQQVATLEQSQRHASRLDAFNAAIVEINAGRVTQGRDALQALLEDCDETALCARAREILAEIERGPKGRR